MATAPDRLGRASFCPLGTTGQWGTGSPRSGLPYLRSKGGWVPWGDLRGGQGRGSWLSMGRLSVMSAGVTSVGVGDEVATRGRYGVWKGAAAVFFPWWSFNLSENLCG